MSKQAQFFADEEAEVEQAAEPSVSVRGALKRVGVIAPVPHLDVLDYLAPEALDLLPGSFVEVSVGPRRMKAIVCAPEGRIAQEKLKPVLAVLDIPKLAPDLLSFISFVADYYMASLGAVLRMVLSSPGAFEDAPVQTIYACKPGEVPESIKLTKARREILDYLTQKPEGGTAKEIAEGAGVSDSVVRAMVDAGLLTRRERSVDRPYPRLNLSVSGPKLSKEQQEAANRSTAALGRFQPFLLEGVTGAGKTEVYFELIAAAFKRAEEGGERAQVLVLLPEIALTSQWLDRFKDRFGVWPVSWHSDVGVAGKRRAWRAVANGDPLVVVGARSALFLPYQNLAAIIVDEEHDPSFKQEEGVLYHARDMAVVRAREARCPVLLASATPSLESRVNAAHGRYEKLSLLSRHGGAKLPVMVPVDMRESKLESGSWISPRLADAISARLERGEQVMLFLNRRGYAPLTLCRTCGHRLECPSCTAWLVEHRFLGQMQCHHCGYHVPLAKECPSCKEADTLTACGPGVERVFEEVSRRWSSARVSVLTSDTLQKPGDMAAVVSQIEAGTVDIIIGTQIVTKGYHFPKLSLVGVIDADLGLRGGDLRAGERTYQQLTQVAGRAGRAAIAGEVMLQTYEPAHPVVAALASGDGEAFLSLEEAQRMRHHMPPFGRLVAFVVSGPDPKAVMAYAVTLARSAPAGEEVSVLGPATAPIARVRGLHRVRLLCHSSKRLKIQPVIRDWLKRTGKRKGIKLKVDVDPYSFM